MSGETQLLLGVGSPRRQQLGLEAPMRELFLSEVGVRHEDTEEGQTLFGKVKATPQKRRAAARAESVETQDYVAALPSDELLGTENRGGGREDHGGG